MNRLTLPSVRGARKTFREALQHNANFSHAFSGLAKTYSIEWVLTARGDSELLRKAEESVRFAIGMAKLYLGELDESLDALARAEELSPHYADAIYSFADALIHASRPKEGLEKIKRALSLNPLGPHEYFWCAAGASYFVGAFDKAVSRIQSMSNQASAYRLLAASCAMLEDVRRAPKGLPALLQGALGSDKMLPTSIDTRIPQQHFKCSGRFQLSLPVVRRPEGGQRSR